MMTPAAQAAHAATKAMTAADWASMSTNELRTMFDANDDGTVNNPDLLKLIGTWGAITTDPPPVITPTPPTGAITWTKADGTQASITPLPVTSPITLTAGINPAGQKGKTYTGVISGNPMRVLSIEGSGANETEIRMENVTANWREYGAWSAGKRITLIECHWNCDNPLTETYSLRDYSSELVVMDSELWNEDGWKRSVRKIQGRGAFVNCTIVGGAFEIGNPDAAPNNTDVPYLLIRGGRITKASDPMNMVLRICNGLGDGVFEQVDFSGGGKAVEIQGTFTGRLAFRGCTRNGAPLKMSDIANDTGDASRVSIT